jgi:hypothetical protein
LIRYTHSMIRGSISLSRTDFRAFAIRRWIAATFCFSLLVASTACHSSSDSTAPPAVVYRPGVTLTADPNPINLDGARAGKTTIYWTTPVKSVQLRLGSPKGTLWGISPGSQHAQTGDWVSTQLIIYLQDNTMPDPTDSSATLAKLTVYAKLP